VEFQRFMFRVMIQLKGKIDRPCAWYNQLWSITLAQPFEDEHQMFVIQDAELAEMNNLYERSASTVELVYHTALFLLWLKLHDTKLDRHEDSLKDIVQHAYDCLNQKIDSLSLARRQLIGSSLPENIALHSLLV
jgi:hypothetical protein